MGYCPWGRKELDMTERISIAHFISKFVRAVRVSRVFTSLIYLRKDVKRKLPIVMISNLGGNDGIGRPLGNIVC